MYIIQASEMLPRISRGTGSGKASHPRLRADRASCPIGLYRLGRQEAYGPEAPLPCSPCGASASGTRAPIGDREPRTVEGPAALARYRIVPTGSRGAVGPNPARIKASVEGFRDAQGWPQNRDGSAGHPGAGVNMTVHPFGSARPLCAKGHPEAVAPRAQGQARILCSTSPSTSVRR